MEVKDDEFSGRASGDVAEKALSLVVRERIVQREQTKRLLIAVVAGLFVVAVVAILFAPQGKEIVGWILGSVLIVLALGAIGASRFLLKVPGAQLNTSIYGGRHHQDIHMSIREEQD